MVFFNSEYVLERLKPFRHFLKYISPSLVERGKLNDWYENRFLFDIFNKYSDLNFIERFDSILKGASKATELNEIFSDLKADKQYDLRIFDVFSEVRFIIWALRSGFANIHKIPRSTISKTPDFMVDDKNGNKIVVEVKHLRSGNPFHDFANDRAKGLLLVNDLIDKIGLRVSETEKYLKYQHRILAIRNIDYKLANRMRQTLTNDRIIRLANGSIKEIDLLNNLLKVHVYKHIGASVTNFDVPDKPPEPIDTLKRLSRTICDKKDQIAEYTEKLPNNNDIGRIESGIIFITGVSNEDQFWWELSEELDNPNSDLWNKINYIYENDSLVHIRIISNFGTTHDNYHDFPRNYNDYVEIKKEYKKIVNSNYKNLLKLIGNTGWGSDE